MTSLGPLMKPVLSSVAALLEARGPHIRHGRRLDPQLRALLWVHRVLRLPEIEGKPPVKARREFRRQTSLIDPRPPLMASVTHHTAEGPSGPIGIRVLVPHGVSTPAPAVLYMHGGGFVIGDLDTHDVTCRLLASMSQCVVVQVDYRLAPEHPHPAAVEDTLAAWRWLHAQADALKLDRARLAVGGDSAGGNLAAVLCHKAKADPTLPMPRFQLLIYPCTDCTRQMDSHKLFAKGYFLSRTLLDYFLERYLSGDPSPDPRHPDASPLFAVDFKGLPPAYVSMAGFDPLCDEGRAYVKALREGGVPTEDAYFPSLIHGYFSMGGICDAALSAVEHAADALRRARCAAP